MATPFMGLNNRSGTPQLKRYINANPTSTGVTFGSADNNGGWGTPNDFLNQCPVVQFGGSNTLYAVVGNAIYKTTDSAASWASVRTLTNIVGTIQSAKTGLYVLYSNGVPELTVIYRNGPSTWYVDASQDGTTWTTYGPFTINGGGISPGWSAFLGECVWDNKLVVMACDGVGGNYFIATMWAPDTHTFTQANTGNLGGVAATGAVAVFNDRCFFIGMHGTGLGAASYKISLFEVTATLSNVLNLETGASITPPDQQGRPSLFVDGANLYALYWKSAATGWRCQQLSSAIAATDITSTVVPAALSVGATTNRTGILIDNATPGSNPSIYVFYAVDGNTTTAWTMYQWNGNAAMMTAVGAPGGLASDAMPFLQACQGSTYWTQDERHVEITNRTFVTGGVRLSFKLYSSSGIETVVARVWYTTAAGEYPTTATTLSNASAGSIVGNAITGLTADNSTTYQVTWNAQTDGLAAGSFAKVVIESSTS